MPIIDSSAFAGGGLLVTSCSHEQCVLGQNGCRGSDDPISSDGSLDRLGRSLSRLTCRRSSVPLIELADEASYEAEIDQCVGVTGYHRWFFLSALAEAFGMRMKAFAVDA